MPIGSPQLEQVGARDNADKAPLFHHRHLAEAVLHHHLLHLVHRHIGIDADGPGVEHRAHRHLAQTVVQGPIDVTAGNDADQPLVDADHGKAFVPIAPHELRGIADGEIDIQSVDVGGHDLAHAHRRNHRFFQRRQQLGLQGVERPALDAASSGLVMATAAKASQQIAHIDGVGGAPRNDLDVVFELRQDQTGIWLVDIHQRMISDDSSST